MHDVFARFHPDELIGLTAVGGTIVVALTWVVAYYWRKIRQVEAETVLKNELVQRGLSVADIERVVRSGKQRAGLWHLSENTRLQLEKGEQRVALVERLVQQGMSSEEIERVLNAVEKNEGGKKVWWKF